MATNGANSQLDLDQFSSGVKNIFDKIENPSLLNIAGTPGKELRKRIDLLKSMVDDLNKPILKSLCNDMISTMISWLEDPQVLCCLIQGIWASYIAKNLKLDTSTRLSLNDSDFGKFLDKLIAFVDFIIIFLTQDIKKLVIFIPDLIKEVMDAVMGMVLLLIQETLFALRDSVLAVIFNWIDSWDTEKVWAKCLPLKQFINILKKYINDYGILADIFTKIKSYTSSLRIKFGEYQKELVPNIKDLEFLYWLRDLLIKLKQATLSFDLCVDYDFIPTTTINSNSKNSTVGETYITDINNKTGDNSSLSSLNNQQGYTIGADGTILVNRDKQTSNTGNWIPKLSNSFLREFIHKQYNIPYDVIDNTITRSSSEDSIQGTNINSTAFQTLTDKCVNTPASEEVLKWILNIRNI